MRNFKLHTQATLEYINEKYKTFPFYNEGVLSGVLKSVDKIRRITFESGESIYLWRGYLAVTSTKKMGSEGNPFVSSIPIYYYADGRIDEDIATLTVGDRISVTGELREIYMPARLLAAPQRYNLAAMLQVEPTDPYVQAVMNTIGFEYTKNIFLYEYKKLLTTELAEKAATKNRDMEYYSRYCFVSNQIKRAIGEAEHCENHIELQGIIRYPPDFKRKANGGGNAYEFFANIGVNRLRNDEIPSEAFDLMRCIYNCPAHQSEDCFKRLTQGAGVQFIGRIESNEYGSHVFKTIEDKIQRIQGLSKLLGVQMYNTRIMELSAYLEKSQKCEQVWNEIYQQLHPENRLSQYRLRNLEELFSGFNKSYESKLQWIGHFFKIPVYEEKIENILRICNISSGIASRDKRIVHEIWVEKIIFIDDNE